MKRLQWLTLYINLCILISSPLLAQDRSLVRDGKVVPRTTIVEFKIFTDRLGAASHGQYWSRELARHNYSVQVLASQFPEQPSVDEKMSGRTRVVKVVGGLDRSGVLVLPRKKFTKNQVKELVEWLRELKSFGAQGSPDDKPVWGLSQPQFEKVFEALAQTVETDLSGKTLEECLTALPAPDGLPYRWSLEAGKTRAKVAGKFPEWQRAQGLSHGATLSLVLRHFGYGFWPARTPEGSLELMIEPLAGGQKLWPLGWDLQQSPDFVFDKFFDIQQVSLVQAPLLDVTQAISVQTETPIVFDTYHIHKHGLKLEEMKVNHPNRRRNWSLILSAVLSQHKMNHKLRVDESGLGFTVVKPRDAALDPNEKR